MTAEDALAYLVAADVARRTQEGRDDAYALRLGGIANRKRLVAWRRENGLCAKCGCAIPADEAEFKHCPKCRKAFREWERRRSRNLTEPQRLARNERARRSYHKFRHGKPAPPKVVTLVTKTRTKMVAPMVTPMVTRDKADGPKRDRAMYMRKYRARKAES